MTTGTVGRGILTRTYPCNISLVMILIWRRKTLCISVPCLSLMFLLSLSFSVSPLSFFSSGKQEGYAMIDLGILSPSELKDIILSKFIALLLQVLPLLAFNVCIIHK